MILKRLVLKTFSTSSQPFLGADYDIFHYSTKLKMPSMHLRTWCNKISDTILSFTANYESLETHRLPLKLTTNDRHESNLVFKTQVSCENLAPSVSFNKK